MKRDRILALLVSVAFLAPAVAAHAAVQQDPSALEEALIYEVNRARSNPQAYAAEQGLGTLLDGIPPAPSLALNRSLVGSSSFHAEEMAANNYFAHQSPVTGDWPNKLARDQGYNLPASWSSTSNNIESLAAGTNLTTAGAVIRLLIEDAGVTPPGHREQLLATGPNATFWLQHREIGAGGAANAGTTYTNYYAIHTAYANTTDLFLTGVVYNDADADGRYDAGEGLAGVTVQAGALSATTNAAGGWSIAAPAGTYTVTATGGAFTGTGSATLTVSNNNRAVDFRSGNAAGEVDFNTQTFAGNTGGTTTTTGTTSGGGGGGGGGCDARRGDRGGPLGLIVLLALAGLRLTRSRT